MFEAVSDAICLLVFLVLSGLVARARQEPSRWRLVLAGSLATALWAAAALAAAAGIVPRLVPALAEVLRNLAWLHLLYTLLHGLAGHAPHAGRSRTALWLAAAALAATLAPLVAFAWLPTHLVVILSYAVLSVIPVAGLFALENILSDSGPSARWGVKHLCLGLGTIFAYDVFFYADALLLNGVNPSFAAARGLVTAFAAPLLGLAVMRIRSWSGPQDLAFSVSRTAAVHTVMLMASGVYLLVMAGIAIYIREAGGVWGTPLQITFLVGVLVVMLAVLASGRVRSEFKLLIQKHFFSYKYDYREGWLRFIWMMSTPQPLRLGERIVRAIADLMDCPAGALWVWSPLDESYLPDAAWNYHGARPVEPAGSAMVTRLRAGRDIIERAEGTVPDLSGWLTANDQAWVVVPLVHRDEVLAFLVLDRARAPRRLDWEDRDLLKTTAAQAAGYVAEEMAAAALTDARRLEDFNRRFAFVVHDIKNVVGQMSLMVDNAKRFGDRPDFQRDMLATVDNAVGRMRGLLDQLAERRREPMTARAPVDLRRLVGDVAEHWRRTWPALTVSVGEFAVVAEIDDGNLRLVLDHLLDNAVAAAGRSGTVALRLRGDDKRAMIEVEDSGPGMAMEFVRDRLFRPFQTSKASGYGLGAYQARYLVHGMGGQLTVDSAPGEGTVVRVVLPLGRVPEVAPVGEQRGEA